MRDEASAPPAGPWSDAYPLRRGFTARRLQPRAGGLRHPPESVPRPEGAGCTRHRAAGAPATVAGSAVATLAMEVGGFPGRP